MLGEHYSSQTDFLSREVSMLILSSCRLFFFSETADHSHTLLGSEDPMDIVRTIIRTVSIHVQKGGTMTNQEDIVECLRPFCADVAVSAAVKTAVLRSIEESFDLSGEDTFLLLFYQTDALVSSTWNRKVSSVYTDLPPSVCVVYPTFEWF